MNIKYLFLTIFFYSNIFYCKVEEENKRTNSQNNERKILFINMTSILESERTRNIHRPPTPIPNQRREVKILKKQIN